MRKFALIVAALLVLPMFAQEMPKPGPEHKVLKEREGKWDTTLKAGGKESKGSMIYKMELGGMWLSGSLESDMFGTKFTGKSFESYDAAKKKYVSVWVDSMSTAPVNMEGNFDKDKKTLTMVGEGPGMDGKTTKYKSVSKFPDANTLEMSMWIGDTTEPMFTVIYKRKK